MATAHKVQKVIFVSQLSHSPQVQNSHSSSKVLLLSRAFSSRDALPNYPTIIDPARVQASLDQVLENSIKAPGDAGIQNYLRFLQFIDKFIRSDVRAPKDVELKERFESALKT